MSEPSIEAQVKAFTAILAGHHTKEAVAAATDTTPSEARDALTKLLLNSLVNMRVVIEPVPHWQYRPTVKARRTAKAGDVAEVLTRGWVTR